MKKGLTELVFILDRSGSMGGLEKDTIGGFNSMIDRQRKGEGEALVTTVLFDDRMETVHDRVSLDRIPKMTEEEYYVRGCTALLDAVGSTVRHIGRVHKYAREEDRPEKTLFVITTDGMENSSRHYDYEKVKCMIERQKEKYGWEFIFIGANIDSAKTAGMMGIARERSVNYMHDARGTANVYASVSRAVETVRSAPSGRVFQSLNNSDWKKAAGEDYNKRSK